MYASRSIFGFLPDGQPVHKIELSAGELSLTVSDLGATLISLMVPSRSHGTDDILLGWESFEPYIENNSYFGATVGRFANRINGARFSLNGVEYKLNENKPNCCLHGGQKGFSRRLWSMDSFTDGEGIFVRLELNSPDGDQGFPGNLHASVCFGISKDNKFISRYKAVSDAPCPINLTNHAYYNLAGNSSGLDVMDTQVKLYSSAYVEVDDNFNTTGALLPVSGTAFDFTGSKAIGKDMPLLSKSKIGGYDHCFVIDGEFGRLRPFGEFLDPHTGRRMSGSTTQPGVQFYTANMMKPMTGKAGIQYRKNYGFCIEPELFPDSPNQPLFPSSVYGPARVFSAETVLALDW